MVQGERKGGKPGGVSNAPEPPPTFCGANLKKITGNLKKITGNLKKSRGSLKKITGSLKKITENFNKSTESFNRDAHQISPRCASRSKKPTKKAASSAAHLYKVKIRRKFHTAQCHLHPSHSPFRQLSSPSAEACVARPGLSSLFAGRRLCGAGWSGKFGRCFPEETEEKWTRNERKRV